MSNIRIAIKRLSKDIKEIEEDPQPGIGVGPFSENPYFYVANIQLRDGPYKGLIIQLKVFFPNEYPIKPPQITLFPGQIDHFYHHHIYDDSFCIDILQNGFFTDNKIKTGYTPAYTLKSILLQFQVFLSDPDIPPGVKKPNQEDIKRLFQKAKHYTQTFSVNNQKLTHTFDQPYPPIFDYVDPKKLIEEEAKQQEIKKEKPIYDKQITQQKKPKREYMKYVEKTEEYYQSKRKKPYDEQAELRENLTCSILKINYLDNKLKEQIKTTYGYPILTKDKIIYNPIPELITYEAFVNQIQEQHYKLDFYFTHMFKSSMGEEYNCWFPIYIDQKHYQTNKQTILNALTCLVHGASALKQYDFQPSYIARIFPKLLISMLYTLAGSPNQISEAFLRCFYHFILLFKKMLDEYSNESLIITKTDIDGDIGKLYITNKVISKGKEEKKELLSIARHLFVLFFNNNVHNHFFEETLLRYIKLNIKYALSKEKIKTKLQEHAENQKMIEYFIKHYYNVSEQYFSEFAQKFTHFEELYDIMSNNETLLQELKEKRGNKFSKLTNEIKKNPSKYVIERLDDDDDDEEEEPESESNSNDNDHNNSNKDIENSLFDYKDMLELRKIIKERLKTNPKKLIGIANPAQQNKLISLLIKEKYNLTNVSKCNEETKMIVQSIKPLKMDKLFKIFEKNNESIKIVNKIIYCGSKCNRLLNVLFVTQMYFCNKRFLMELERLKGCLLQVQMYECMNKTRNSLKKTTCFTELMKCGLNEKLLGDEFEFIKKLTLKK